MSVDAKLSPSCKLHIYKQTLASAKLNINLIKTKFLFKYLYFSILLLTISNDKLMKMIPKNNQTKDTL